MRTRTGLALASTLAVTACFLAGTGTAAAASAVPNGESTSCHYVSGSGYLYVCATWGTYVNGRTGPGSDYKIATTWPDFNDTANPALCQKSGGEANNGSYKNHWWMLMGNGWSGSSYYVSEIFLTTGTNDEPDSALPICS